METFSYKWNDFWEKSIEENSQLSFSKKINISVKDSNGQVVSDILDFNDPTKEIDIFKDIFQITPYIVFFDSRTSFFKNLKNSNECFSTTYFPLTKEKFRMNNIYCILNKEKENSYIFNFNLSTIEDNLTKPYSTMDKDNDYLKNLGDFMNNIKTNLQQNLDNKKVESIFKFYWDSLNEEEKLNYQTLCPESFKDLSFKLNDVDKFDTQEIIDPLDNFSIVLFFPYLVERTVYPKPQVVANSRKPNFESLFKPRKVPKVYLSWFYATKKDTFNGFWFFKELNI